MRKVSDSTHNPKVVGSNPAPATKLTAINRTFMAVFFACWSNVLYLPLLYPYWVNLCEVGCFQFYEVVEFIIYFLSLLEIKKSTGQEGKWSAFVCKVPRCQEGKKASCQSFSSICSMRFSKRRTASAKLLIAFPVWIPMLFGRLLSFSINKSTKRVIWS